MRIEDLVAAFQVMGYDWVYIKGRYVYIHSQIFKWGMVLILRHIEVCPNYRVCTSE